MVTHVPVILLVGKWRLSKVIGGIIELKASLGYRRPWCFDRVRAVAQR